jgi:hypothetical protein
LPVVEQPPGAVVAQSLFGSVPMLAGWHCPSGCPVSALLHAMQVPAQGDPQQT